MKVVYLETSALLRILFDEEGAEEAEKTLRAAEQVVSSRLLKVEVERALLRIKLDRPELEKHTLEMEYELRSVWAKISLLEMTREICDLAGRIAPASRLRSLDAIHLSTFRVMKGLDPETTMLTFDERVRGALSGFSPAT
jgi:hypothetical protein